MRTWEKLFRRDAVEACLQAGAWDAVEHHAAALEDYARREPSAWTDFVIARGRALAAHGRGEGGPALVAELARLKEEAEHLGHLDALPAVEASLTVLGAAPQHRPP